MLKRLPVRRWQSRQWHIEIFNGSPSHLIAREPQWHCVVRGGISFFSEEACIHGTEKNCQCPHAGGRAECPTILPKLTLPQATTATIFNGLLMEWSGRAPAPPANNAGMGRVSNGALPCP